VSTSRFNPLFWLLIVFFSGAVSGFIVVGPNPGPQMLEVIEIEMDSGPNQTARNIPRPRRRQTGISPVDAQPMQAAAAPPMHKVTKHSVPDAPSVQPLAAAQNLQAPSADTSLSGVSTSAAAAAAGFMTEKDYFQLLKMRVEALKTYPEQAKKQNQQGLAVIEFSLNQKGQVSAVRVHKSSGSRVLDRAALQAVQKSAPFPRAPQGMFTYPLCMRIGVSFELT
jgi:protein TonB